MITPENEVTLNTDGVILRYSRAEQLEAHIQWGMPWATFRVLRTGPRSYRIIDWVAAGLPARSPGKRLVANDWFGY